MGNLLSVCSDKDAKNNSQNKKDGVKQDDKISVSYNQMIKSQIDINAEKDKNKNNQQQQQNSGEQQKKQENNKLQKSIDDLINQVPIQEQVEDATKSRFNKQQQQQIQISYSKVDQQDQKEQVNVIDNKQQDKTKLDEKQMPMIQENEEKSHDQAKQQNQDSKKQEDNTLIDQINQYVEIAQKQSFVQQSENDTNQTTNDDQTSKQDESNLQQQQNELHQEQKNQDLKHIQQNIQIEGDYIKVDGQLYKAQKKSLDFNEVAKHQIGDQFSGKLHHDPSDAYSWSAIKNDGSHAKLDFQAFVSEQISKDRLAVCINPFEVDSWIIAYPIYTIDGKQYKQLKNASLDLNKVANWQYGEQFSQNLHHDPKNAFSWKAILKDGSHADLDLHGYYNTQFEGGQVKCHYKDINDAYSWILVKQINSKESSDE